MSFDDLRALTDEVLELRTEWSWAATMKVLSDNRNRGDRAKLRAAALSAANDPRSRTPAAIAFDQHWKTAGREAEGKHTPLPECAGCGQPRRRHRIVGDKTVELTPPPCCPKCGDPWADIDIENTHRPNTSRTCPGCGRADHTNFPRCSHCGAELPDPGALAKAARRAGRLSTTTEALTGVLDHIVARAVNDIQSATNRRGRALCQSAIAEAKALPPAVLAAVKPEEPDGFVLPF